MKIGINASMANFTKTGIGWYVANLIKGLADIDEKNQYILYTNKPTPKNFLVNQSNFLVVSDNFSKHSIWEQTKLPFRIKKDNLDIFHTPNMVVPLLYSGKSVVTVHDFAFKYYRKGVSYKALIYYNSLISFSLKKATKIIAISEHTKKEILELYNIPEEKINVVYLAGNPFYHYIGNPNAIRSIKEKYKITNNFLLFLGIEKRRNIYGVLSAFARLKKEKKIPHFLVLAGSRGRGTESILQQIEKLGISDDTINLGYVSEEDLNLLYNAASVFVYPSFYEGFGLPLLEAASCKTPIVTSNVASIPEIVGEAALKINPNNIDELAEAIYKILTNKKLQEELRGKGAKRASLFSWQKTALKTLKIYEQLGGKAADKTPFLL